jgi:hypothetical protein
MEYPDPVCQAQFTQKSSSQRHLPAKGPGNPDTLELESCKPRILSGGSLLCNWLHFPQETGIHVENKASHRDILFTVGAVAVQRFWYGWKM